MIGIEALAFTKPDLEKVQGIFLEVSHTIERPLNDFDRSHSRSITKKQVSTAIKKTDSIIDQVNEKIAEGKSMILALRSGKENDIKSLELQDNSAELLLSLVTELTVGNRRLLYTFFKAEADNSWSPHIAHLRYMKTKSLQAFEEYKKVTTELARLAGLYLIKNGEDFSFDLSAISKSIDSEDVEHPDWVKSSDDFVDWIQSMKKDA
ncbi:hypothetical protein ACLMPM_03640 [Yersinia enterocolitica]|uniref:hypothetical protein n=1 Tax=Yersinia enterocolitica TaxID=630 RepID=UPI0029B7D96A|nr:hypothetical protein [Yersinia enterocolitica]EKN6241257.1 hypothetical protein [Yersinia enterocolitica]HDL7946537.1 hypothetical protein [Yersinia enterocolitica]HEI6830356.1 hypothetical protein [Yersinia enterocolitica]HEI6940568.1 hypothetical protein [Yersinia enterocolitica]